MPLKLFYFKVKCFENAGVNSQACLSFLANTLGAWALRERLPHPHPQPQLHPPSLSPWELLACMTVSVDGSNTQGHLIVGKELPSACQGQMQTHKAISSKTSHQREPCLGLPRAELPLHLSVSLIRILRAQGAHGVPGSSRIHTALLFIPTPEAQALPESGLGPLDRAACQVLKTAG